MWLALVVALSLLLPARVGQPSTATAEGQPLSLWLSSLSRWYERKMNVGVEDSGSKGQAVGFEQYFHAITSISSMAFFAALFKIVAVGGMMLGGVVVFVPQYVEIWSSGNCEGFSTHVCLILIVANLTRICFWFVVRFETPLLLQSVFVTIAMLAMQELCVRCRLRKSFNTSKLKSYRFFDLDLDHFWRWTYFSDYVYFLSVFFVFVAFITNLFMQSELFVDTLGFIAVCTEALLLLPQLIQNYKRKSTIGLSVKMVLMMLAGDLFKTGYYIARKVPSQFWICSIFQVSIDLAILFQVVHYSGREKLRGVKRSDKNSGDLDISGKSDFVDISTI